MNFVSVCKNCRRTIESDFLYCPWCGAEQKVLSGRESEELSDDVFRKLESKQFTGIEKRIRELKEKIEELEREFDGLSGAGI